MKFKKFLQEELRKFHRADIECMMGVVIEATDMYMNATFKIDVEDTVVTVSEMWTDRATIWAMLIVEFYLKGDNTKRLKTLHVTLPVKEYIKSNGRIDEDALRHDMVDENSPECKVKVSRPKLPAGVEAVNIRGVQPFFGH